MIYFDYSALTPIDPRVKEAMLPYLSEEYGNPSSIHRFGQKARRAIDSARDTVIKKIGAFSAKEIIFTGSGTESCNMAVFGSAFARENQGKHLIVSAIEHPAILEPARYLRDNFGFELTELMPNSEGLISVESLKSAIRKDTIFVSLMMVNNEIGTIQPVKEFAEICREKGIIFHTDACQAPAYLNVNVDEIRPDLLTLNGAKIYGPQGVGLLYVREGLQIMPLIHGGGQEFRMRGGTESTAQIVGFAKAMELLKDETPHIKPLRDYLLKELLNLPNVSLNGSLESRIVNNINLSLSGISGESMVMKLDMAGIAVSSGSACSSGKTEASHVLMAMGQSKEQALNSLRISLGRYSTQEEVEKLVVIMNNNT